MRKLITCATLAAALAATTVGTAKAVPPACFTLATRALTGPAGGDVSLAISPLRAECVVPSSLKRVRLKTFGLDGKVTGVRNLTGVPITAGHATIGLGQLARGQRVEVDVLIDAGDLEHLYVLQNAAVARLRPDLVVSLTGPPRLLAGNHGTIVATIAERNGDTGAAATVALSADGQVLASRAVQVPGGGNATASFDVSFETATDVGFRAVVTDADPGETDEANNAARRELEVTDAELDASTVIVPSLAGYGGQFNHRIYSKLGGDVGITPENLPDLEQKVVDLQPQFSRIFVNDNDLKDPDRLQSFKRTVELAQRAGTAINVTWQGGTLDVKTGSIPRLADALVDLVQNRGVTKLVWLTLQNEPNSTSLTPAAYEERYRALDPYLLPIRAQVRYMGGDLVRDGQRAWFDYMATQWRTSSTRGRCTRSGTTGTRRSCRTASPRCARSGTSIHPRAGSRST
jgi:hypothetical protein